MTTYKYSSFTVQTNATGAAIGFANSTVEIVLQNDWSTVDFSQYVDGSGVLQSAFYARLFNIKVNGVLQESENLQLGLVSWTGGAGIYFSVKDATQSTWIWVDGDQIPATNLAQYAAFAGSSTISAVPKGSDFAQQSISVSAFAGLIGISENDIAFGNEGNNLRIYLTAGNDSFLAGEGNDEVYGGTDNDTLDGGSGYDKLYGDEGNDVLTAGITTETDYRSGDDLYGGAGDDMATGGDWWDGLYGGDGRDTLYGGGAEDVIWGDAGNDQIFGGAGNDARLDGGDGRDIITGGRGSDLIFGGQDKDRINGGRGNDDLSGGLDADRFAFADNMGRDVVRDFDVTEGDRLFINAVMVGNQNTLTSAEVFAQYGTDLGDSLVFNFDGGGRLLLLGVADVAELGNAFSIL